MQIILNQSIIKSIGIILPFTNIQVLLFYSLFDNKNMHLYFKSRCLYLNKYINILMRARSSGPPSLARTYNVQQQQPRPYMVHYLFILQKSNITPENLKKISNLYSQSQSKMSKQGFISFLPLGHTYTDFNDKMKLIKSSESKTSTGKQEKLIKLIVDPINCKQILDNLKRQNLLSEIDQIYLCRNQQKPLPYFLRIFQQFKNEISQTNSLGYFITLAQKQIQKWRKKYQITRNSVNLNPKKYQQAFLFRIRMFANKNLKPSKYAQYRNKFMDFIKSELKYKNKLSPQKDEIGNNKINNIKKSLDQAINFHLKILKIEEKQVLNIQQRGEKIKLEKDFISVMFKLYKAQGFFYEILNEGIRKIYLKNYNWQCLSLPISFMYKAVLLWYQNPQNKSKYKFDCEQLVVWRGGKIKNSQLEEMKDNLKVNPFYQFFSFLSTSTNIDVALKFMNKCENQKQQYNCLYKIIIKKPKCKVQSTFSDFFDHGFCFIQNLNNQQQEDECLINAMTIGKITDIKSLSIQQLKKQYKITTKQKYYENIPIIQVVIGDFQELCAQNPEGNKKIHEMKIKHKSLIQHFIYSISLIKKYQSFDFADAYQLCNEMEKSYKYLLNQFQEIVDYNLSSAKISNQNNANGNTQPCKINRFKIIYQQQNICTKLAEICQKMGKLSEAETYNNVAIKRYKQLQEIDKNRCYQLYSQKLNRMYLQASRLLIQQHKYFEANRIILKRIKQLQEITQKQQQQKNKVIIAKFLIDLGIVNFKQGKLHQAKETFHDSAQKIEQVFQTINYNELMTETHYWEYFKGLFTDTIATISKGIDEFFEQKRKLKIQEITKVYGGQKKLLQLKKNANDCQSSVISVITHHRQHFADIREYQQLIQSIDQKIETKLKKQQQIPQQLLLNKNKKQLSPALQLELLKQIKQKKNLNKHDRLRQQINKQLIMEEKSSIESIKQQQKQLFLKKEEIQMMRLQNWQNPSICLQRNEEFLQDFNDLLIKKQEVNRQKLLHNDEITIQQLSSYYKESAKTINSYINQLSRLGYSNSAPKVLKLYNNLIQIHLDLGCQESASKQIEKVKQFAAINKEEKYYELAVAYFLNAKILYSSGQIDFLIIIQQHEGQIKKLRDFQLQKTNKALEELNKAIIEMKKALCNGTQDISEAYRCQPKRIQILLWQIKCYLKKYELQDDKQLLRKVQKLLGEVNSDINKIVTMEKHDHQATYYEIQGIYYFYLKKYKQSHVSFKSSIKIRQQKFGEMNWQNILTFIKMIYLFYLADNLKDQLTGYYNKIQKSLIRYKQYPFYWKLCLAHFYINKQCQNNQKGKVLNYLEECLIFMEKIGFADEHFYFQYKIVYQLQYEPYFKANKPYLQSKIKIPKKKRQNFIKMNEVDDQQWQISPQNMQISSNFMNTGLSISRNRQTRVNSRRLLLKNNINQQQQQMIQSNAMMKKATSYILPFQLSQLPNLKHQKSSIDRTNETKGKLTSSLFNKTTTRNFTTQSKIKKIDMINSMFHNEAISEFNQIQSSSQSLINKQSNKPTQKKIKLEDNFINKNQKSIYMRKRQSSQNIKMKIPPSQSIIEQTQQNKNNLSQITKQKRIRSYLLGSPPLLKHSSNHY